MTNKLMLIGIGIAAIGLMALPQTLALFSGQHDFYEVSQDPNNLGVPCGKCHGDVYSELSGSQVHSKVKCESCHVLALTINGAKVGGKGDIHAAAAPACTDCHGTFVKDQWHSLATGMGPSGYLICTDCHSMPITGGILSAKSIFSGANESHTEFALNASNATLLKGANEACVGCHTHVNVDITWQKPTNLSFNASVSAKGVWNVTDFTASGVKETKTTG